MGLNIARDDFHRDGVHRDAARAEYHAISHNGLGIDSREGLWSILCEDWGSWVRHVGLRVVFLGCIRQKGFEKVEGESEVDIVLCREFISTIARQNFHSTNQ
jgi:hypothetical protein